MRSIRPSQICGIREWDNENESHFSFHGCTCISSCAMPSPSFGCTQPPLQPSAVQNLETWPAWTTGTDDVNIIPNNVPAGPVSTAMGNWINGLLVFCYAPFLQESSVGQTGQISMSFAAIPAPSPCPTG